MTFVDSGHKLVGHDAIHSPTGIQQNLARQERGQLLCSRTTTEQEVGRWKQRTSWRSRRTVACASCLSGLSRVPKKVLKGQCDNRRVGTAIAARHCYEIAI